MDLSFPVELEYGVWLIPGYATLYLGGILGKVPLDFSNLILH
ncbi:hypothetical protein [Stieleria tagensis]|nr:hypothetical protein [Stieleria tagensis]